MGHYVGIDYGTGMLKAAIAATGNSQPEVLPLANDRAFVPAAVFRKSGSSALHVGWDAFVNGYGSDALAVGFRDQLLSPASSVTVAGQRLESVTTQSALFLRVGAEIQSRVPGVLGLAVSVPDCWSAERWSLPMAAVQAGWLPVAYVREANAVLAAVGSQNTDELLMLSLGTGTAQATVQRVRGDFWERAAVETADGVSGLNLRRRLVNLFAEETIQAIRRDPRIDYEADRALRQSVDDLLTRLQFEVTSEFRLQTFGKEFRRTVTRDEIAAWALPFRKHLERVLERALASSQTKQHTLPIVAWGELANLLPLSTWLARFLPARQLAHVASLHSVAFGTARLCALTESIQSSVLQEACSSLRPTNGAHESRLTLATDGVIPLWERLPIWLANPPERIVPNLVCLNGQGVTPLAIESWPFRFGRDPRAECHLDGIKFPMVSAAHTVILCEGTEYLIRDLDSRNGTFVNGKAIRQEMLSNGDVIRLGQDGPQFRFELPGSKDSNRQP